MAGPCVRSTRTELTWGADRRRESGGPESDTPSDEGGCLRAASDDLPGAAGEERASGLGRDRGAGDRSAAGRLDRAPGSMALEGGRDPASVAGTRADGRASARRTVAGAVPLGRSPIGGGADRDRRGTPPKRRSGDDSSWLVRDGSRSGWSPMFAPRCFCPEGVAFRCERDAATARRSCPPPEDSPGGMARGKRGASEEVGAGRRPRREPGAGERAAPRGAEGRRRRRPPSLDVPGPVAPATDALLVNLTGKDAANVADRRGPCRPTCGGVLAAVGTAVAGTDESRAPTRVEVRRMRPEPIGGLGEALTAERSAWATVAHRKRVRRGMAGTGPGPGGEGEGEGAAGRPAMERWCPPT